jgi:hypothetical protein
MEEKGSPGPRPPPQPREATMSAAMWIAAGEKEPVAALSRAGTDERVTAATVEVGGAGSWATGGKADIASGSEIAGGIAGGIGEEITGKVAGPVPIGLEAITAEVGGAAAPSGGRSVRCAAATT